MRIIIFLLLMMIQVGIYSRTRSTPDRDDTYSPKSYTGVPLTCEERCIIRYHIEKNKYDIGL